MGRSTCQSRPSPLEVTGRNDPVSVWSADSSSMALSQTCPSLYGHLRRHHAVSFQTRPNTQPLRRANLPLLLFAGQRRAGQHSRCIDPKSVTNSTLLRLADNVCSYDPSRTITPPSRVEVWDGNNERQDQQSVMGSLYSWPGATECGPCQRSAGWPLDPAGLASCLLLDSISCSVILAESAQRLAPRSPSRILAVR
jgi:hypothetical protein